MKNILKIIPILLLVGCASPQNTDSVSNSSQSKGSLLSAVATYNKAVINQDTSTILALCTPKMLSVVHKSEVREHVTQPMGESKIIKIEIEHISTLMPYAKGLFAKVDTRTYLSIVYPKGISRDSFVQNAKAHMGPHAHAKATFKALLVDFPSWLIALKAKGSNWKFVDKEYLRYT